MSTYPYSKLPDARTYVRRLHLEPGEGDSILKGWLDTVEISSRSPYDALSYYWGPDEFPCNILLQAGGREYAMPITRTLDMVLKHMRYSSGHRIVWTDAICVNQSNRREKGPQVRIMDKVYTSAARVVVYLGRPAENGQRDYERVIALLNKIHASAGRQDISHLSGLDWVKAAGLPSVIEAGRWEPLKAFFRLPWFRRKWTIQECTLASELEFHYGTWSCQWPWMLTVLDTISDRGLAVVDYTTCYTKQDADHLQKGMSQVNSVKRYRRDRAAGGGKRFLDVVYEFQTAEATDMRDHLYALLGLANDTDHAQLEPQYGTLTMMDLCLRYAYFFLHRDQTLELLYRAGLMDGQQHGPSWIPNWYGFSPPFGYEPGTGLWDPGNRPAHLNVARGTRMVLTRPAGSIVLGLRGMIIDTVEEIASGPVSTPNGYRNKRAIAMHRRQHLIETDAIVAKVTSYPTNESVEEAKWRTLICNTTEQGFIPAETGAAVYQAWRQATLDAGHSAAAGPFDRVVNVANSAKVFGRTAAGYFGMFPPLARRGDEIAVMLGGEFPIVLRSCGPTYPGEHQLVGQCYIHGIMERDQFDMSYWRSKEKEILLGGFRAPGSQALGSQAGHYLVPLVCLFLVYAFLA